MEKELIEKIKDQIKEIKKISFEDRHFNLAYHVSVILTHLIELKIISNNQEAHEKYEFIWNALDYSNNKEVRSAKESFEKAKKKNASYLREKEYHSILNNAIDQVLSELSDFNK